MGDEDLSAFYREHHARLFRFAWRLVHSEDKAADLVQEAWCRCLPRFLAPTGAVAPDKRAGYLYRAVHNLGINLLTRSREDATELAESAHGAPAGAARDHAESVSDGVDVWRCLQGLTAEERSALVLAAFEGFRTREIAEVLQLSDDAVFRRVKSAESKLRRCLQLDATVDRP